ncbi:MAG TPA: hypothetical protein VN960_05865 [Gaiellaceae bacterium]|nr:hypothetical protein [Gaiellaceae bacterium]
MAEQAVWHLKRVTLAIPVPSVAAIRARAWMIGPPLLLGLLAALIATQVQARAWRGQAEVSFAVATPAEPGLQPTIDPMVRFLDVQARLAPAHPPLLSA